ncbi:MAG: hypothetical protein LZF61_08760 [Nitrosomonas sp.]|nr:MAG: hypothetical protein LZF61_08760 [Nitrosomonas sp.]
MPVRSWELNNALKGIMAMESPQQVKNPLTLIAIFAGLAEVIATAGFFLTLNFNHRVLYAPGDFKDERHFFAKLSGGFALAPMKSTNA